MDATDPALLALVDRVMQARREGSSLCLRGGGTKDFYGEARKATCSTPRRCTARRATSRPSWS
jgi:hypothetical protein